MTQSAVALALFGAIAYGTCDFIGGVAARRSSPWPVALLTGFGVLIVTLAAAPLTTGNPHPRDFALTAFGGLAGGAGSAFFYRGLTRGAISVVAPISAVGSAIVPVLVGAAIGERPSIAAWLGIAIALPAIWLVSGGTTRPSLHTPGVGDGVLAGASWGALFAALGSVGHDAGLWPMVLSPVVASVTVPLLARGFGASAIAGLTRSWLGLVAGLLAGAAQLSFIFSARAGQLGVSAVVVSLYPAMTVFLAIAILRERLHRGQIVGLVLSALSVAFVAVG